MNAIGTPLGILIGLVSGIVVLWLFSTTRKATVKEIPILIGQLLLLAGFWSGGAWAPGVFLKSTNIEEILPSYLLAIMCVFTPMVALGIFLWLTGFSFFGDKRRLTKRSHDD